MFRRVLSLILCVCMLVSTMPTWSVAALAEGEEAVIEAVEAPAEKEEKKEDPTPKPTKEPTPEPTKVPTPEPTKEPTPEPTKEPTPEPTKEPTPEPTKEPTPEPTKEPTPEPTEAPVEEPTEAPAEEPTEAPAEEPTEAPAEEPTEAPVEEPTEAPVEEPTEIPAEEPDEAPVEEAPRFVNGYAFVKAGEKVYADDELDEVLGTFPEKTVVYVSDREETQDEDQDILTLRFACDDELVKGYIRAKRVQPLTERETADYEEEAAADGVRYRDQIFVLSVAFAFADKKTEEPTVEEPTVEEPAAEEPTVEEPTVEEPATEEPATEEPTVEEPATEEPTVEEPATEEPTVEEPTTEEPVAEEPTDEEPAAEGTPNTEEHQWNDGVCEECGAVCTHEQTTSVRYENAVDQQSIVNNGDGTHTYQAGCYILHQCSDCGQSLGYELEGELSSVTAAHEFGEEDVCWICGAQNVCAHPADSSVKRTLSYIAGVVGTGEHYHVIDYDLVTQMYCQACGQFYGEQTAMGTQRRTEAHFFGEDGLCNCGATGEPCADWETHFKASEQHTVLENIHTEQVTGEDGQTHEQTVATQVTGKQCALCGGLVGEVAVAQVTGQQTDDPTTANAPAFGGELADWDNPVTITNVIQTGDKVVTLEWEGAGNTAAYRVFEVVGGEEKLKATVTTGSSATLKAVAVGSHVFVVRPYDAASGQNGTNCHRVTFVVQAVAWKAAPVIGAGAQVAGAEGMVKLSWTHKSRAESYAVYDTFNGEKKLVAATTELSIVLEGQEPGKHAYTVQPVQKDSWGNEQLGTSSKAKAVTVAALWNKKPTIAAAAQKTTDESGELVEGQVALTWKRAAGALTQAYAVQEYIASSKEWVFVEFGEVFSEEAVVSVLLENVAPGAHTYRVLPAKLNENGDIDRDPETGLPLASSLGLASATKAVTVVALWNKKGVITKAVQLGYDEGKVELTWNSGSTLTQAWQICERTSRKVGSKITYIYTPVEIDGRNYILSSDATVVQEIDAAPGTHYYAVRPVLLKGGEVVEEGLISAVKAVGVVEKWKTAPVITSLAQVDGLGDDGAVATVELTWNAGSGLTQAFRVYDKVGSGKTAKYLPVTDVIVGETRATIELTKVGVHSFIVYPVNPEDEQLGAASAAKAITVKAATWKDAPTLTAVQKNDNAEGEVLLQWSQIVPADAFKIYEYRNKQNVALQDENGEDLIVLGGSEKVLEGVTPGAHIYSVLPLHYDEETGDYQEGTFSAKKTVTVTTQWLLAPTITEAVQTTEDEGAVSLKWKAGSPLTQAWYIKDNGVDVKDAEGSTLLFTEPEAKLTGVKAGVHKYTVIPAQTDGAGNVTASGKTSAAKAVTVYALWNKKPVIKSAAQLATDEMKIAVQWTSPSLLPEAFIINVKVGTRTTTVLGADEFKEGLAAGEITVENGVYTAVIDAPGIGSNVISVAPAHWDENAGKWVTGLVSTAKTAAVKALWNLAPAGVTAKQITSSAELQAIMSAEDVSVEEGMVLLAWKPGNNPNLAQGYKIYDNGAEIAYIDPFHAAEPENAILMQFYGYGVYGENQVILLNQKAGAHKYTVRAVNEEGNLGTASLYKAVAVTELWKTKPVITKAIQSANNEITVTWTPGSELTTHYYVTDKVGSATTTFGPFSAEELLDEQTGAMTKTLDAAKLGTHQISVKPAAEIAGKWQAGAASAVANVVVANTQWSAAPVMEAVEQSAIGEVTLTWRHPSPADGFIIYEMVGSEFKKIHQTTAPEFSCTVPVETTGTHTYAVRSYMIDTENGGIELMGTMSRAMSADVYAASDVAPKNLRVTRDHNTAVVTWDAVPFATGYRVTMVDTDGQPVKIEEIGSWTSATFTNITPDASYAFVVCTYFGSTVSDKVAYSEYVNFGKPVTVTAEPYNPNDGGVVLTWTEPTTGLQGIRIYRMDGEQETLDVDEATSFSSNKWIVNRTYVDTLAQPNKTYTYWVASYRYSGEDELSAPVTVTTSLTLADLGAVTAYYAESEVNLHWLAIDNATAYDLYRAQGAAPGDEAFVLIETVPATDAPDGEQFYADLVEDADSAYTYYVKARWDIGTNVVYSNPSAKVTAKPIAAPYGLKAVMDAQSGGVLVSWLAVDGATYYVVYRSDKDEPVGIVKSDVTSVLDTSVKLGKTYTYTVMAMGENASRTSAGVSVELGRLDKVTGLTQWHENETVTLTWSAVSGAQYYVVERSYDNGATYDTVSDAVSGTTFEDPQVSDGVTYLYRVRAAVTIGGNTVYGAYSTPVTVDISPIMEITAEFSLKKGGTVINWPKSEKTDVLGYKVFRSTADEDSETELIAEVGKDVTSLIDDANGLTVGKTYYYSVRVVRTCGEDGQSISVEVMPIELGKVQNVRSWYIEDDTHLIWDEVEQADCYEVTRTGNGKTETFETDAEALTSVTDRVDDPEAEYVYSLRAVVKTEAETTIYGEPSDPITVVRKPGAKNVKVNVVEKGVQITWTPMDTTEMIGFTIFRIELDKNSQPVGDNPSYKAISTTDIDEALALARSGSFIDRSAASGARYAYTVDVLYPSDVEGRRNARIHETDEIDVPSTLFLYTKNDDGTATVTGYTGTNAELMTKIPETVDGLTVTAIGDGENPFSLPEGVTMTGTLTLPETVKTINAHAFDGFTGLTGELIIPDGVTGIAVDAFAGTKFTSLKSYAAVPKAQLDAMGLPETVMKLESDYDKEGEQSFEAFGRALKAARPALELILHGETSDGVLYDKDEDGNAIIIGLKNASGALTLPATVDGIAVAKIGENAFKGNTAITSVTISGDVTEIGDGAFDGCSSLTTAVLPNSVEVIGVRGFADCTKLSTMTAK